MVQHHFSASDWVKRLAQSLSSLAETEMDYISELDIIKIGVGELAKRRATFSDPLYSARYMWDSRHDSKR